MCVCVCVYVCVCVCVCIKTERERERERERVEFINLPLTTKIIYIGPLSENNYIKRNAFLRQI